MGGELTKALSALATGALLLAAPAAASPFSVINGAEASRRGETTELRFAITARSRFRLSQHGSQLWIDLERTRVSLPPRPLYGREPVPITTLRVVNLPPSNARILMEVTQKTDYAVGFLPGTLLVRLAPAGRVANIDRVRIPFADKPRSPKPDAATKPEPADDDSAVAEDETPRH